VVPNPGSLPRAVVLVEGDSDRLALEALAARRARDLAAEGVAVMGIGGATNIRRFLDRFGPHGLGLPVAGMCDLAEEGFFRRGLQEAGLAGKGSRDELEANGFYVCEPDLEGELIRALGTAGVEAVIEAEGELGWLRLMQRQPAQQGRTAHQQLHRFMGTRAGRKAAYARRLVEALDPERIPAPLDGVLRHV
jgi:hypothetical protein